MTTTHPHPHVATDLGSGDRARLGRRARLLAGASVSYNPGEAVVAQLEMGSNWRIGVDESKHTELVTSGAFSVVRNPIFTAMGATGIGLALMVPNVVSLLGMILLTVAIELRVRAVEEPFLARLHGAPYAAYAARVGRFLPGLGRMSPATTTRSVA